MPNATRKRLQITDIPARLNKYEIYATVYVVTWTLCSRRLGAERSGGGGGFNQRTFWSGRAKFFLVLRA
jgi:hypothetical protein